MSSESFTVAYGADGKPTKVSLENGVYFKAKNPNGVRNIYIHVPTKPTTEMTEKQFEMFVKSIRSMMEWGAQQVL